MPVYEFVCKRCERPFEELVLGSERVACPSCGASEIEKQLSRFATQGESARADFPAPGACGTCGDPRGPGSCSMN